MNSTKDKTPKRANISFAAIDPFLDINIVLPTETRMNGRDIYSWGDRNAYPDYLLELYDNVPTLRAIINGNVDFITGDEVTIAPLTPGYANGEMNTRGDTIREQVRDISKDYELYGGFALQVIRNFTGKVVEVYYIDMRYLRTNKENTVFYYSENWGKGGTKDVITYPAFIPGLEEEWMNLDEDARNRQASSILFVKNVHTQVYPAPRYAASVKACEIERCIDDYHLNSINNGFVSSLIVNFNNGVPEDPVKEEIEDDFNEKFAGHTNGGRIVFCWNKSKENATTFEIPHVEDFGEKYKALSSHCRQQIFTAFRANPNLFGIPTEGNGFANEQYEESYRLYNRTQIRPVQRRICDAYDKIYGLKDVLNIKPFSLDEGTEKIVE